MKNFIIIFLLIINILSCYQETEPLNSIVVTEISLPKDDNDHFIIKLTENKEYYEYNYKDLKIDILYYIKDNHIYDDPYDNINIEYMQSFEQHNNGIINEMPEIVWHQNIRYNIINGYKYVDAFIFLAHESTFKNLIRILYFTTKDYYIRIRMTPIFDNDYELEILFENIYKETPQYFIFDPVITFYGKKVLSWGRDDALEFGNDLLSGIHGSKIVNIWFTRTEEILNKIQYK
jgi:hypothetical protein